MKRRSLTFNTGRVDGLVCAQCRVKKPHDSGVYVPYNNNKNQKWLCIPCVTLHYPEGEVVRVRDRNEFRVKKATG